MPPISKSMSSASDLEPAGVKFLIVLEKLSLNATKNSLLEAELHLKAIQEQIFKNYGLGQDATLYKVIKNIIIYFSTLLSPAEYARAKEVVKVLVGFLINIGELDDIKKLLNKDENGILKFLTILLMNETNPNDCKRMMTLIELLSRNMTISWKIPYVINLINYAVNSILKNPENIITNLQFLINVCRKNHCCVLILRSCDNYKAAWKALRDQIASPSSNTHLDILVCHFNYLVEVCIPVKNFLSGYELASMAMKDALGDSKSDSGNESRELMDDMTRCQLVEAIRQMIESICEKMKFVLADGGHCSTSSSRDQSEQAESIITSKNTFLELVTKFQSSIHEYYMKNSENMSNEIKGCLLSASLSCLLPYNINSMDSTLLQNCKTAAETACEIFDSMDLQIRLQAGRVVLRVCELIDLTSDEDHVRDFMNGFRNVIKTGNLLTNPPMVGLPLEWNTVLIRLYTSLLFDSQIKEVVKKKLTRKVVQDLFSNTISEQPGWNRIHQTSVFAVDLMTLLSRLSESTELLMAQLSNPEIVGHISRCIRNGDEKEIAKTLHLISCVAFNRTNIWATAKSLKQAQEQVTSVPEVDVVSAISTNNWRVPRTDLEIMDYVVDNKKPDPSTSTASDILSWCQIRQEVHQHEINMLNSHIMQLNRTIANLNGLLEKQSNFVAKHISVNEQRDLEVATLQHRFENSVKESESKLKAAAEESSALKQHGLTLTQQNEVMTEKIKVMEKQIEELTTTKQKSEETQESLLGLLKKAKEEKKNLREDLRKAKSEHDTATSKIAELDRKLSRTETERDQLQQSLDKKQKMIDAVSSIVGKQFNFDV